MVIMCAFNTAALCRYLNGFKPILKKPSDFVYHYTSKEAARNIIIGNTLRFTDRYYLNDYSEGKYIFELCKEHLEELMPDSRLRVALAERLDERITQGQRDRFFVYQCSLTVDKDSLCMWNYYTNQDSIQGYNLIFDSEKITDAIHPTPEIEGANVPIYSGMVVYSQDEQLSILKTILNGFIEFATQYDPNNRYSNPIAGAIIDKLSDQGIFFKKSCFSIENEFRVAISAYMDENTNQFVALKEERKTVNRHGLNIPYVDIHFDKDALVGITLSPTLKPDDERDKILDMTGSNGYTGVTGNSVFVSEIPVRF